MKELEGKNAVVTGGSRGIGRAIALRLAEEGANVAITYSSSGPKAEEVVQLIKEKGVNAKAVQADATRSANVAEAVAQIAGAMGPIDILVNNAGVFGLKPLHELTIEDYHRMMTVNVESVFAATAEAVKTMPEGGRVINIGSVNGDVMPVPGGSLYAASKGAVQMLTKGWARDLGERKITVNVIQPGPIDTEMNPGDRDKNPMAEPLTQMTALKTYGTPEDVAELALFLASKRARNITGSSINTDGGMIA